MNLGLMLGIGMIANESSGAAVPAIATLNYSLVDIGGGGQSVVITGTDLAGATGVDVEGTAATITANDATSVTVTMPVKTAGTYDVTVTTPGGTSNALEVEYWSPTQLTAAVALFDAGKNITHASNAISQWDDQVAANDVTQGTGAQKPTRTANAFGTVDGVTADGGDQLTLAARDTLGAAWSIFWVSKHTLEKSTRVNYAGNAPLTVVGDATGQVAMNAGFDGTALCMMNYDLGWNPTTRGTGFNDGVTRLYGWTYDGTTLKAYVGATQEGLNATIAWSSAPGWRDLFHGFGGEDDGFAGDVGAIVIVDAATAGAELTKLHKWSQQHLGAA